MPKPPPVPEPSFKRGFRDMQKIRPKRVVRVDTPHILAFFLTAVIVIGGAFAGGVLVEQRWPGFTWWPWLAEQLAPQGASAAAVAAPDRTLPPSADVVAPALPVETAPPPAQMAAIPPLMAPGRVDPIEMGPRPVNQAFAPVEAEHPAAVGQGGSEDNGTLEMPLFVLDSGNNDALAYTIQVKAFREEPEAQVFLDTLRKGGYDAWLVQSALPDQGVWWRVRVGRFATMTEAADYQRVFEDKENLSTFVSPL